MSHVENGHYTEPMVSVLMSVYGEPLEWLREAVGSILQQTYTDFEFIIVNDNPEREELDGFLRESATGDRRIHIIRNPENIGLTKSLNIGLRECRGRYVARMDADDVSHSTRFEKQVAYMDAHSDVVVCGTDINYFGDVPVATYSDWIHESDEEIKAQMLSNSGFAHPTVMIRREVLEANSISYDEAYRQGQDYRLWEQLYDFGKFANIGQKLYGYRLSASQVSKKSNTAQVALGLAVRRRIIKKWLLSNGIDDFVPDSATDADVCRVARRIPKHDAANRLALTVFLRTYYFSRTESVALTFFRAVAAGHFFRFSFKDKCRYAAILFGLKKPIAW